MNFFWLLKSGKISCFTENRYFELMWPAELLIAVKISSKLPKSPDKMQVNDKVGSLFQGFVILQ